MDEVCAEEKRNKFELRRFLCVKKENEIILGYL